VTLCTTPFARLAAEISDSLGMADLTVVLLRERLADRTLDEIDALAMDALPRIVSSLAKA
jgi:hypothetical protein